MLRLPAFEYHRPQRLDEAVRLLADFGPDAMPIAGGTDLVPNMKHGLFTPRHVVSLASIAELHGIRREEGPDHAELWIGATTLLSTIAADLQVRQQVPALAQAAAHVAGPQLRNRATLGGNLCLDTRCTYYNQTEFWRQSLGYCLKKDGTVCHVTRVGRKCVAAHSADTPPILMVLEATVELAGPAGRRSLPVADFFVADGIRNTRRNADELVVGVRIPLRPAVRAAYVKLRQRKAIDFPLLTVAVAGEFEGHGTARTIRGVVTGLGSRPRELEGWHALASGRPLDDDLIDALAERAFAQCHPLENQIVDPAWRRAMVPVHVKRALGALRG